MEFITSAPDSPTEQDQSFQPLVSLHKFEKAAPPESVLPAPGVPVSLPELRQRLKETSSAIQTLEGRINYINAKEMEAVSKLTRVNRKVTVLQYSKSKSKQHQQLKEEAKRRMQVEQENKCQFNKLLKEHLRCNKEIIFSLFFEKKREIGHQVRLRSIQHGQSKEQFQSSLREQLAAKAQTVKEEEQRVKRNIDRFKLRKQREISRFKENEERLRQELSERERAMIQRLQQREHQLLEKVVESQRFRQKCEIQLSNVLSKRNSFKL